MIKKKIKIILERFSSSKRIISVYQGFYKRHKAIMRNGQFKKNDLTAIEKKEYLAFWGRTSKFVNSQTVMISKSLSGKYDKFIVPEELFPVFIEPFLNVKNDIVFLERKNIYNKWFENEFFPQVYFHKINDIFYNAQLEEIADFEIFLDSLNISFPIVLKPSVDSYGGKNVYFLNNKEEILQKVYNFSNLVIQEKIVQHTLLSEYYEESINTIRVCLLRRPSNNEIVVLNASLRMGKDGSLDNETAGGIVCNINQKGVLNDYAVDKYGYKFFKHPNSGKVFKNSTIPFYDALEKISINIGKKLVFPNLMSLDMCLDSKGKWRCIEVNLLGQTIRFAQYAGTPFFGDYTEEVVDYYLKNQK